MPIRIHVLGEMYVFSTEYARAMQGRDGIPPRGMSMSKI